MAEDPRKRDERKEAKKWERLRKLAEGRAWVGMKY